MDKSKESINVYIVTYNRAKFLRKSIQSVLRQTYRNFDLYILDNCSIDETRAVVDEFDDNRIHYICHPSNIGGVRNMIFAHKHNDKEFYVIFHDDEIMKEKFLEKEISFMRKNKEIATISCTADLIDFNENSISKYCFEDSKITYYKGHDLFDSYLEKQQYVHFPSIIYRKSFIQKNKIELKEEAGPSSDILFSFDVEKNGGIVAILHESLIKSIRHEGQDSEINRVKMIEQLFDYLKQDSYYSKLLVDNIEGRRKYLRRMLYNEACLLAADSVDLASAKADGKKYYSAIRGGLLDLYIYNMYLCFFGIAPKIVKKIYNKYKKNRMG